MNPVRRSHNSITISKSFDDFSNTKNFPIIPEEIRFETESSDEKCNFREEIGYINQSQSNKPLGQIYSSPYEITKQYSIDTKLLSFDNPTTRKVNPIYESHGNNLNLPGQEYIMAQSYIQQLTNQ